MKEITVRPSVQALTLLLVLAAIAAAFVKQLPELRRYQKARSM